MNIWDSVQRGFEKASQEAGRIARIQRLRSTVDSLSRLITTLNETIVTRTMEVFEAGQLTQVEILPLCEELAILKQQLEQAQNELKLTLSQPAPAQPNAPGTYPTSPATGPYPLAETMYAPPPPGYQPIDTTSPLTAPPPPPPGVAPITIGSMETLQAPPPSPITEAAAQPTYCTSCYTPLIPGHRFCSNCGAPIVSSDAAHLPTVRADAAQAPYSSGNETVRADTPVPSPYQVEETERADMPPSSPYGPQAQSLNDGGQ